MLNLLSGKIFYNSIKNNYKKITLNLIIFICVLCLIILMGCQPSTQQPNPDPDPDPDPNNPFTIYYALNESHSNSWVQLSAKGVIGIVYGIFEQNTQIQDGRKIGNLIYKTIQPNGSESEEIVTSGKGVDKSVLLYDSNSYPHIFFASSDNSNQTIYHLYQNNSTEWIKEAVINFYNEGGKFIYELSADIAKNDSIHLLVLKSRSNPDSEDFLDAYVNSHLFHITNSKGTWEKALIHNYDTFFTYDMHVKTQRRQDIAVDDDGYAHIVFGEQYPLGSHNSIGILHYATNKSTEWVREIALKSSTTTDDAGWYPSLCLDTNGNPVIASTYVARVETRSVRYTQLCYSVRLGKENWETTVIAEKDDGYFGTDGRKYTGALPHLKFDSNNTPHIVFSDIASSHNPQNILSTGQIRYAVLNDSSWDISTIYSQPSPQAFYQGKEMAGQCLVISENGGKIQVIGQELESYSEGDYSYNLVHFIIK